MCSGWRNDVVVARFLLGWSVVMVIVEAIMITHAMVSYDEKAKYVCIVGVFVLKFNNCDKLY